MAAISQREARRLRKRVEELERQIRLRNNAWATEYPGGVHIATVVGSDTVATAVLTARKLRHAVVVTNEGTTLRFYALPEARL